MVLNSIIRRVIVFFGGLVCRFGAAGGDLPTGSLRFDSETHLGPVNRLNLSLPAGTEPLTGGFGFQPKRKELVNLISRRSGASAKSSARSADLELGRPR